MSGPYYVDESVTLWLGDCLDVMRTLPDASVDAIVTDPPYGLEFMGKGWDAPWQESDVNTDAGFSSWQGKGFVALPSSTGSTNPKCLDCKGTRRGRRDGTAERTVCLCTDGGRFPNTRAVEMRAFQQWCTDWTVECLRVLKPGGYLLAFGGSRTWHRLACAVEDAGFEIRDSIAWLYGSGFAKSWNFRTQYSGEWCSCNGRNALPLDHAGNPEMRGLRDLVHPSTLTRSEGEGTHLFSSVQRSEPGTGLGAARVEGSRSVVAGSGSLGAGEDDGAAEPGVGRRVIPGRQGVSQGADAGAPERAAERVRPGTRAGDDEGPRSGAGATGGGAPHQSGAGRQPAGEPKAVPGSPVALDGGALRDGAVCARCGGLAEEFRGFGSALKPAFEPVVVARKPLAGTIQANVLAHGTGALNVDGCRVQYVSEADRDQTRVPVPIQHNDARGVYQAGTGVGRTGDIFEPATAGRWPTNVILEHLPACDIRDEGGGDIRIEGPCAPGCPVAELDRQSGTLHTQKPTSPSTMTASHFGGGSPTTRQNHRDDGDEVGASRFFPTFHYEAKAPTAERPRHGVTAHPTVKPVDLMRWLVRLVTPPGGLVLDPFAGSGTTAEACVVEGFRCILIEREADYLPLIVKRLTKPIAPVLDFGASA